MDGLARVVHAMRGIGSFVHVALVWPCRVCAWRCCQQQEMQNQASTEAPVLVE